jgi:cytochrome bd ubiquinol oxidase subunit I
MSSEVTVDRLQFTLMITYHYLFPILTMGLALFIAYFKTVSYKGRAAHRLRPLRKTEEERATAEGASRFWAKIFAVNFAFGVVTGIPMEFQFGTNWAQFSNFAGGVIGQTLAMEGVFAFFLESVFLGILLAGAGRVGQRLHWLSAVAVLAGSWISGWFIIATNAWMQHPVGYSRNADGDVQLESFWDLMTNPWLPWQYLHNMGGAAITGAFVVAAMGAYYLLNDRHHAFARMCLRVGVVAGFVLCALQIFPTGDRQGENVARHQPSTFAAMEGLFRSGEQPLAVIGNPDTRERELESSIELPNVLSFLTHKRWDAPITGLNDIPQDEWPDSVPLVYYSYHIMVGLGTILLLVAGLGVFLLWRGRLYRSRAMLWALMLAFPFTYIANIAGWATAETGRQPWLVYGLLRTEDGASPADSVPAGTAIFTMLGFGGLYLLMGIVFLMLILRIVVRGPEEPAPDAGAAQVAA